ncbi:MAG: HipA domain-containing protein [Candidatus Nanopelagicales bacterium]
MVDATHAAVVVRYDRVPGSDGSILRVHQEGFGQALAYPARQTYERDGGPGLKQVGALIQRLPAHLREDPALRLFDALALNYAIAGTHGHARSVSLLPSGPDAALAPPTGAAWASIWGLAERWPSSA